MGYFMVVLMVLHFLAVIVWGKQTQQSFHLVCYFQTQMNSQKNKQFLYFFTINSKKQISTQILQYLIMTKLQKTQKNIIFRQAESGLDLKTEILFDQCIHVHQFQSSYISYYKGDNDLKMVTKIIDLGSIKHKPQTKKMIEKYLTKLRIYLRKFYQYQYNQLLPAHLLEICKLKNSNKIRYVSRPWIDGHSLYYYLKRRENQFLQKVNIQYFLKKIISIQISCQGIQQHLLTDTNLFIGSKMNIQCNYASMVGLSFISANQIITKNQFYQIYPYLDSQILSRQPIKRNNFNLKIRGIVVNLLKLIIVQEFNLLKDINLQDQISPKDIQPIVNDVSKLFEKFLERNSKKIQQKQKQINQQWQRNIAQNFPLQFSKKLNLIKLFTDILVHQNHFSNFQEFLEQYLFEAQSTQKNNSFLTLHNQCWKKEAQRKKNLLQTKGLNTLAFYLPIKWGIDLSKIFKTEFWFDQLIKNTDTDNDQILRMAYCVIQQVQMLQNQRNNQNQYGKRQNSKTIDELTEIYAIARNVIKKNKIVFQQSIRSKSMRSRRKYFLGMSKIIKVI